MKSSALDYFEQYVLLNSANLKHEKNKLVEANSNKLTGYCCDHTSISAWPTR